MRSLKVGTTTVSSIRGTLLVGLHHRCRRGIHRLRLRKGSPMQPL
jgi:hypothetical protein